MNHTPVAKCPALGNHYPNLLIFSSWLGHKSFLNLNTWSFGTIFAIKIIRNNI
jgi:hypothetical protein